MSVDSRDSASPSISDSISPPPVKEEEDKIGENSNSTSCTSPELLIPSPSPKKEKEDEIKPPDGKEFIKRPLNPYMCWVVQKRKEVLKKNPKMKMSDVNAMLGDMWKKLTDEERRPYFEQSYRSREEHKVLLNENPNLMFKPVKVTRKPKPDSEKKTPRTPNGQNGKGGDSSSSSNQNGLMQSSGQSAFTGFRAPAPPTSSSSVGSCVAQALGVRVPNATSAAMGAHQMLYQPGGPLQMQAAAATQQLPSASSLAPGQMLVNLPGPPAHQKPQNIHQSLEQYYTSLCQPAFPEQVSGEVPLVQYQPNFYWEQCQQMQAQMHGYHY